MLVRVQGLGLRVQGLGGLVFRVLQDELKEDFLHSRLWGSLGSQNSPSGAVTPASSVLLASGGRTWLLCAAFPRNIRSPLLWEPTSTPHPVGQPDLQDMPADSKQRMRDLGAL